MRKYEEMISEFAASNFDGKQKWLYSLTIEELREFRRGLPTGTIDKNTQDWIKYWKSYIDSVISHKINEMRDQKLNDLGI